MEELPTWHARQTVARCLQLLSIMNHRSVVIKHVRMDAIRVAHVLANIARTGGPSFTGSVNNNLLHEAGINIELDRSIFALG
jgi:hypothetical protein